MSPPYTTNYGPIPVYTAVEMAADKKFVCHVDVKCSNARPENTIWNDEKSLAVR